MTGVVHTQLTGLARTLAELKERVRVAVAGELGRAVSGAVQQVVQAVVAGRADPPRPAYSRWDDREDRWGRPHDRWADDTDAYDRDPAPTPPDAGEAGVGTAVAASLFVAKWWLGRRGTLLGTAGLGLGVGLLGVLGGPAARAAVAALAAAADILGVTDALGAGTTRLDSF